MKDFLNMKQLWSILSRSYSTTFMMWKAVHFLDRMIEKGLWEQGELLEVSGKSYGSSEWVAEGNC